MAGREKPRQLPTILFPGPGFYDAEYTAIKRKPPMYSMGGKHKIPSDDHMKPGPGAHCPEKINLSNVPAYSFGIKHSPYLGNIREHHDHGFSGIC